MEKEGGVEDRGRKEGRCSQQTTTFDYHGDCDEKFQGVFSCSGDSECSVEQRKDHGLKDYIMSSRQHTQAE
jgi:hypothetical protein